MKPIKKYITDFLEYCEIEKGLSPISVKNYAQFLRQFEAWLDAQKLTTLTPKDLTAEHIWDYRIHLSRKRHPQTNEFLSKSTQSYYLIALRGLLSYFVDKDIKSLPPDKIKLPKDSKDHNVRFLSLEQLEKLLLSPNISNTKGLRDRAILETFFSTGLRIAELVSLNISDLGNTENNDGIEIQIIGKGGRARTVYFSRRCLDWIGKYLSSRADDDKSLFARQNRGHSGEDSKRITARSIERVVKYYALRAGLPHSITPHVLRHTYATDLLSQGVDLRIIQELLGHKNIVTTQIYTHVTNKELREAHKKFHSGNKLKNS
ncbi:MAG: hypothetical protein A3B96_02100 [Candidatus Spechtbacteria bacterium RIFCSPHIGHO2_02_FULL_43_15b]|uniref:Tyrosine recombinase XerC n=1 Tax=Candidatus Spechtbacteria bacterium RIFCSPHIGHO2_01_FULL_43_30 TaxID=1802158 RepID=A0A1G2H4T6_9BACT|nr:MAG: hypothetical protein A2827_02050 [Candidatus Spechtbacteria bacterium RIFCSPHIGHO2_01_FULL_43_30]OGZ58843.1 MAG: hypothetical protein A3B96_02100 [Candidatus Spechtbacteria bacterium RIFCSPHIGHO2_02_FULL_43_15b]